MILRRVSSILAMLPAAPAPRSGEIVMRVEPAAEGTLPVPLYAPMARVTAA